MTVALLYLQDLTLAALSVELVREGIGLNRRFRSEVRGLIVAVIVNWKG
jgi:hypothetical protein